MHDADKPAGIEAALEVVNRLARGERPTRLLTHWSRCEVSALRYVQRRNVSAGGLVLIKASRNGMGES